VKVSVIIPTLNAAGCILPLLERLRSQTVSAEILIIDSSSDDGTTALLHKEEGITVLSIPRSSFDHGGTRDMALRRSSGDFVLFLTQDALPVSNDYIEKLLAPFENSSVAAVCGRQAAYPQHPESERLTREFNYPGVSRVWSRDDIPRYGVKAYFFSDVCSAYRRSAYEAVGGFDRPLATNEDMLMASKLIHAGYSLAYCAEAAVYHSHAFTLRQDYTRSALSARVMEQYKDRLPGADSDAEGFRMVFFVLGRLLKKLRLGQCFSFGIHVVARFLGSRKGKKQGKTPQ